jgi:hypothetical protein
MKWIELPILLYTEVGEQLEDLGIENEIYEPVVAKFNRIDLYYEDPKTKLIVIYVNGSEFIVDMSKSVFEKMLARWQM